MFVNTDVNIICLYLNFDGRSKREESVTNLQLRFVKTFELQIYTQIIKKESINQV